MSETFDEIRPLHEFYQLLTEEAEQLGMAWDLYSRSSAALTRPQALDVGEADILGDWRTRYLNILRRMLRTHDVRSIHFTMGMRSRGGAFRKVLTVNQPSRDIDEGRGPSGQRTRMFAEWQIRHLQVIPRGGGFYRRASSGSLSVFDTSRMESHGKAGFGSFVLDLENRMYVFNHLDKTDRVAHSSFVKGAPVKAAGEIRILNGRLKVITNHSGHYTPDKKVLHDTLVFFQGQSISLTGAVVAFVVNPGLTLAPLTPQQLPWVFLSDVETLRVVMEGVDDEVAGIQNLVERARRRQDLIKLRSFQQAISANYVYGAGAFVRAVALEDTQAAAALDDFLGL